MGQWSRVENPEIGPHSQAQLIFDKGIKVKKNLKEEDSLFNKWCWESFDIHRQKMNLNLSLKYCANINSKSIRLKKYETKNYVFFRKNIGENLQDLGLSKEFLDLTPHIKFIRKKMN